MGRDGHRRTYAGVPPARHARGMVEAEERTELGRRRAHPHSTGSQSCQEWQAGPPAVDGPSRGCGQRRREGVTPLAPDGKAVSHRQAAPRPRGGTSDSHTLGPPHRHADTAHPHRADRRVEKQWPPPAPTQQTVDRKKKRGRGGARRPAPRARAATPPRRHGSSTGRRAASCDAAESHQNGHTRRGQHTSGGSIPVLPSPTPHPPARGHMATAPLTRDTQRTHRYGAPPSPPPRPCLAVTPPYLNR